VSGPEDLFGLVRGYLIRTGPLDLVKQGSFLGLTSSLYGPECLIRNAAGGWSTWTSFQRSQTLYNFWFSDLYQVQDQVLTQPEFTYTERADL